jgi:hypothetical protein
VVFVTPGLLVELTAAVEVGMSVPVIPLVLVEDGWADAWGIGVPVPDGTGTPPEVTPVGAAVVDEIGLQAASMASASSRLPVTEAIILRASRRVRRPSW